MVLPGETHFQALSPKPFISTGVPFVEACKHHAVETFGAKRIYTIVSKSISTTSNFTSLKDALGDLVVGIRYGIRQHVPFPDVLEVANDLLTLQADLIVTLGAGSLTDGAKIASWAAANGALTLDDLEKLRTNPQAKGCTIPTINIPTSLSGGEYNPSGGATDLRNHRKSSFKHPSVVAELVILDPELTLSTPERVWLSSGMRSVDHCVEGLCSIAFRLDGNENVDTAKAEGYFVEGLKRLLPGLLATKKTPGDLEARRTEMLGVLDAMRGMLLGVAVGASHGIGHQLGPLGVGHGETSCVMLPSVLEWNRKHGDAWVRERQKKVLDAFWGVSTVVDALHRRGLSRETATAGQTVRAFVEELGMPTSLASVGVGREKLKKVAENAMASPHIPTNPARIAGVDQIREILELALEDAVW
ncbi:hypothetical protein B0T16DRAFT_418012 [Cercophora newfieldiana]|uniref:Alcohol dehydrogenase iron-type/glycerol dehydrogenase GldA domain-containing protein n=1 Tax=Cercophora newfieldiana TaxID=92897 RepID=A0AA39Y4D8_9PEZI|nr:hypothetical protein B0T16DRAFT_418012 [Cercophora newfieldiana]